MKITSIISLQSICGVDMRQDLSKGMVLREFACHCRLKALVLLFILLLAGCNQDPVWADPIESTVVVRNAVAEIGRGEMVGDNKGADIRKYFRGDERGPWCAAMVSYVLYKSKICVLPYYWSAISYYKTARDKGWLMNNPRPGDLIVFWRVHQKPLVHGHIGIVEKVTANQIITIEGNLGKFPSKVKRVVYKRNKDIPRLLGFIRLGGR